jgi:hypothetical protein
MKRHNRGRAGDMRRAGSLVLSFLARVNTNSQCHCTPESDTWIGEPRIRVYSPTRWLRSNRPYHVTNMSLVPGLQIYMYSQLNAMTTHPSWRAAPQPDCCQKIGHAIHEMDFEVEILESTFATSEFIVSSKKAKTYNRRDSQMVTHSSTSRPVQCLCMAERTGCPVLTDLWSYVLESPDRRFRLVQN